MFVTSKLNMDLCYFRWLRKQRRITHRPPNYLFKQQQQKIMEVFLFTVAHANYLWLSIIAPYIVAITSEVLTSHLGGAVLHDNQCNE